MTYMSKFLQFVNLGDQGTGRICKVCTGTGWFPIKNFEAAKVNIVPQNFWYAHCQYSELKKVLQLQYKTIINNMQWRNNFFFYSTVGQKENLILFINYLLWTLKPNSNFHNELLYRYLLVLKFKGLVVQSIS